MTAIGVRTREVTALLAVVAELLVDDPAAQLRFRRKLAERDSHLPQWIAALPRVGRGNAQNEYYLTDVIGLLVADGKPVGAYCVEDAREVAGVNDPGELEAARRFVVGGSA